MKMLSCIIQPYKLEEVKDALRALGIRGMTVSEVRGFGRQMGHKEIYRGREYDVAFVPKLKIEIVMDDDQVESAIAAITDKARTGKIGDGKIFVFDLHDAVRIRTGERGDSAM